MFNSLRKGSSMEIKKRELCIVHIGMPKAGSSSLQQAFSKGLEDDRVSYAKLPHSNQSGWIYGLFVKDPLSYHFFREWNISTLDEIRSFREESRKLLIDDFCSDDSEIKLISGEDLFHLHAEGIEALKK